MEPGGRRSNIPKPLGGNQSLATLALTSNKLLTRWRHNLELAFLNSQLTILDPAFASWQPAALA